MKRLIFLVLLLATALAAQTANLPEWGTFQGGAIDHLDVANLQVHITIPIVNKPGRGLPLRYSLDFDSMAWGLGYSGYSHTWYPGGEMAGSAYNNPIGGVVSSGQYQQYCYDTNYDQSYLYYLYYNFSFISPAGVSYSFPGLETDSGYPSQCDPGSDPGYGYSASETAGDNSGYTMMADGSQGTVTTPDGLAMTSNSMSAPGGSIQESASGVVTDSLGVQALTISGSPSSGTMTYAYPGPDGTPHDITVTFADFVVASGFGCAGVSEYSGSRWLPTGVQYPDGSAYLISYEVTPNQGPGHTTGRVAQINLPDGGNIQYAYAGGNDDINCSTGDPLGLTRTENPGNGQPAIVTSYSIAGDNTNVETGPAGAQHLTVYTFSGTFKTEEQIYNGPTTSSPLLRTEVTCYNGPADNCTTTPSLPVTSIDVMDEVPAPGGVTLYRHTVTTLNAGHTAPAEVDDTDWGATPSTGGILRKTLMTYPAAGVNGFANEPVSVKIENAGGAVSAETDYSYDTRGNPTTIQYTTRTGSPLTKSFTYQPNSAVATATDVNGAVTDYTYSAGVCNGAFPIQISRTTGPVTLQQNLTWNCDGGVVTSVKNANNNTTSKTYDDEWRPAAATDAAGNVTVYSFSRPQAGAPGYSTESASETFNGGAGSSTVEQIATLDGLGRRMIEQRNTVGTNFNSIETLYDAYGGVAQVSVPYQAGESGGAPSPWNWTTYTRDALGRPLVVTSPAGGTLTTTYNGNDVYQDLGPAPTSENDKRRQDEFDGLGRIESVCEITAAANGGGNCAQTSPQTGYWTEYSHNPLGEITGVTQNAQNSADEETRSFSFDELGRMTQETVPESGTTSFHFGSYTGCPSSAGDLAARVDAIGNVSCYGWDSLHRLTSVTYPSANPNPTDAKYFAYDAATFTANGKAMTNALGRMVEAYTGSPSSIKTDLYFSYDSLGRATTVYQYSPNSGNWYETDESYYPNGAPASLSAGSVTGTAYFPAVTYSLDAAGDIKGVNAASGQDPLTAATYNQFGLASLTLGSGDTDSYNYTPASGPPTGQLLGYTFTVAHQPDTGTLSWNANGSLASFDITDGVTGTSDSQSCGYTHDDLGRLAGVSCTGQAPWSQDFSYDAFGNIKKTGTQSFGAAYNDPRNQISSNINVVPAYDADGDLLDDPVSGDRNVNQFDADGKPVKFENATVVYL